MEELLDEVTARKVLDKQREWAAQGKHAGVADIVVRHSWISTGEAKFLMDIAQPVNLLPGLRLERLVATGGMGRVYKGVHLEQRTDVAVKILHPRLTRRPESLAEFTIEANLLVQLEHPALVKGYYLHEHEGLHYLVMEWIRGGSAAEELEAKGRLEEGRALAIVVEAARALAHLHEQGLVHRDVKPANILLGPNGVVKLCDLGLVVRSGSASGETTSGTKAYFAPEQARGDGLDARADIYSLGVTLYHLVVGSLPFGDGTDEEAMARRLLDELRSPALKALGISQRVHYFIQKMMALDPAVRYQSPAALAEDISAQLRVSAPPSSGKVRSDMRTRRNP
jgi:serine/threonine-protein kinase